MRRVEPSAHTNVISARSMSLASRILFARKAKRWSQARLGERTGFAPTTISKWETNKSEPSTAEKMRLAEALEIDPTMLGVVGASRTIPVVGVIKSGLIIHSTDASRRPEVVDPPLAVPSGAECVVVHGDALMPIL